MVAGGSGGHIYPALALAEELEARGHEITFLGSKDRMEKDVIPAAGFPYIGLDVDTTRGGLLQKVKSLSSIVLSYRKCLKLLKGYDGMSGKLRQQLTSLGFTVTEDGKHYKLTYYGDERYVFSFAKSPSDFRSGKNNAGTVIKKIF